MTDIRPIRVALYARVSTSNHGQDVALQTRELKEFIAYRGWQFAGEYADQGISGSKVRRPELDRLMAPLLPYCARGKILMPDNAVTGDVLVRYLSGKANQDLNESIWPGDAIGRSISDGIIQVKRISCGS